MFPFAKTSLIYNFCFPFILVILCFELYLFAVLEANCQNFVEYYQNTKTFTVLASVVMNVNKEALYNEFIFLPISKTYLYFICSCAKYKTYLIIHISM